jgi:hypothetical protein
MTDTYTTLNAYQLAAMAEVSSPDGLDTPGARFLLSIQDDVIGWDEPDEDTPSAIADGAVPIYTHEMWQTFTDLAAWQEDVDEFGPITDMEMGAQIALYLIAERLVRALLEDDE